MSKWQVYKLEELCETITDGAHSSPKEDSNGQKMIATVKDMSDFGFLINQCKRISDGAFDKLVRSGCVPRRGDVLFSKDGTIGKVLCYDSDFKIGLLSSIAIFRPDTSLISGRYLSLYLRNKSTNRYVKENYRSGSAIPRIILRDFKKLELSIPSLQEQKAIASILSALDDKIEVNLQMNKTLEEMAMALYKHWFVDFGPFQDVEFVDSELGKIPKGWEVKELAELGKIFYGKMPKKELLQAVGYTVYSGYRDVGFYPEKNCLKGKVIVVARGVGGTGDVKLTKREVFLTNLSICVNNELGFLADSILFYGLRRNGLHHLRTGSAQPQITIKDLQSVEVLVPPKKIQGEFLSIFKPLLVQLSENEQENQTLTNLRDTMLPKLISGEVRVKDIEQTIANTL